MEGFSISVGRDVNGGIRINQTSSGAAQPWSLDDLKRVFAEFETSLRAQEPQAAQGNDDLLAAVAELQSHLVSTDTPRELIHKLALKVRDLSIGTASSLLAAIVTAQVPWIWTSP